MHDLSDSVSVHRVSYGPSWRTNGLEIALLTRGISKAPEWLRRKEDLQWCSAPWVDRAVAVEP